MYNCTLFFVRYSTRKTFIWCLLFLSHSDFRRKGEINSKINKTYTWKVLSISKMRIDGWAPWGPKTLGILMQLTSLFPPSFRTLFKVFLLNISRNSQTHLHGPTIMACVPWKINSKINKTYTWKVLSISKMRINGLAPWEPKTLGILMQLTSLFPPHFRTLFRVFLSHISLNSQTHLCGPTIMARVPWNLLPTIYFINRKPHLMLRVGSGFGL